VFKDVHEDSLTTCLFVLDQDKNWELTAAQSSPNAKVI